MDVSGLSDLFRAGVGVLVSGVANLVYFDLKRRGRQGWTRIVAFWVGTPFTWISLILLPEGSQPSLEPPEDNEEALLEEIRRDRAVRGDSSDSSRERPNQIDSGGPSSAT